MPDKCPKTGKLSHADFYSACRHLKQLARVNREPVGQLSVYRCYVCQCWHVGHTSSEYAKHKGEEAIA